MSTSYTYQQKVLDRFSALTLTTCITASFCAEAFGSILIGNALTLFSILGPALWLTAMVYFIYKIYKADQRGQETPMYFEIILGMLTGAMFSGFLASYMLINPFAIIFAASSCGLVLLCSLIYAKCQPSDNRPMRISKALGITAFNIFLISTVLLSIGVLTGSPAYFFFEAILISVFSTAGIICHVHNVINDNRRSNPALAALCLFTRVIDLFVSLTRLYALSSNKSGKNTSNISRDIKIIACYLLSAGLLFYYMLSGGLFRPQNPRPSSDRACPPEAAATRYDRNTRPREENLDNRAVAAY